MKLLFAVVQNSDQKALTRALIEHEISVTKIASSGGYLSGGNTTLMIGVQSDRLQDALDIIREKSSRRHTVTAPMTYIPHNTDSTAMPMEVVIGGATVFVVDASQYYKF